MVKKLKFRRLVIPGEMLEDSRLDAEVRETYGKLARLSFKRGYCWPSNSALDGTESGRTASRHIRKLEEAGYIKVKGGKSKKRKIKVVGPDAADKDRASNPATDGDVNPATDGGQPSHEWRGNPATDGGQPRHMWRQNSTI
jgi:DNA-binding transcriptional ArsR family regulator